eukprot:Partr_v1_DN28065_c1_g1_i2_m56742 putative Zinc finger, C2H2 type
MPSSRIRSFSLPSILNNSGGNGIVANSSGQVNSSDVSAEIANVSLYGISDKLSDTFHLVHQQPPEMTNFDSRQFISSVENNQLDHLQGIHLHPTHQNIDQYKRDNYSTVSKMPLTVSTSLNESHLNLAAKSSDPLHSHHNHDINIPERSPRSGHYHIAKNGAPVDLLDFPRTFLRSMFSPETLSPRSEARHTNFMVAKSAELYTDNRHVSERPPAFNHSYAQTRSDVVTSSAFRQISQVESSSGQCSVDALSRHRGGLDREYFWEVGESCTGSPYHAGSRLLLHNDELATSFDKRRYICELCQKRFLRPSSLQQHIRAHTGERPFQCSIMGCGKRFSVMSNLRRHMRIHESGHQGIAHFSYSSE